MADWTREQADALLANGTIDKGTHRLMLGSATERTAPGDNYDDGGSIAANNPGAGTPAAPSPAAFGGGLTGAAKSAGDALNFVGRTLTAPMAAAARGVTGAFNSAATGLADATDSALGTPRPVTLPETTVEGSPPPFGPPAPTSPSGVPAPAPKVATGPAQANNPAPSRADVPTRGAYDRSDVGFIASDGTMRTGDPRVDRQLRQHHDRRRDAYEHERNALSAWEEGERLQREADDHVASVKRAHLSKLEVADSIAEKEDADYKAESKAQLERIKLAADEAANAKVDPKRFWKEAGTSGQILGAIAIGLGGFAAGLTRTNNSAMAIIDKAIDRDIAAQERDINQRWKKVDSERGILGDLRQVYGDTRLARADAKARAYDRVIAEVDAITSEAKSPIAKANADKLKEELLAKKELANAELVEGMLARQKQLDAKASAAMQAQRAAAAATWEKVFEAERKEGATPEQAALTAGQVAYAKHGNVGLGVAARGSVVTDSAGTGGTGGDPLAGIPKRDHGEATKELSRRETKERTLTMLDQLERDALDRSPFNPLNAVPGTEAGDRNTRIDTLNSQIISLIRGRGDNDIASEKRLGQLTIKYGDNDATIRFKLQLLRNKVEGNNPTPVLDRYQPREAQQKGNGSAVPAWKPPTPATRR